MDSRPHVAEHRGEPYAVALGTGGMLAVVYFVVSYLRNQYFGCAELDYECGGVVSHLFFGVRGWFVGFLVVPGWVVTAVIAPSMLNMLRPDTTWWWRGLISAGACVLVTALIIAIFGGILTYSDWG
jgi:hypothetical protein